MNLSEITYVDWQLKINALGEAAEGVDDINQCIAIILTTRKGSVPHRPTFGSNIYKYIDYPVNEAKPNIIRETIDSISLWESRIEVNSVLVDIENEHIKIKVQWTLKSDKKTSGNAQITL